MELFKQSVGVAGIGVKLSSGWKWLIEALERGLA